MITPPGGVRLPGGVPEGFCGEWGRRVISVIAAQVRRLSACWMSRS